MAKEMTRGSQAWDPQAASVWGIHCIYNAILGKVFDFEVHTLPIPCLNQNMAIFMIILAIFILIKELTMRWVRGCITWSPSASCWLLFKGVGEPVGRLWTRKNIKHDDCWNCALYVYVQIQFWEILRSYVVASEDSRKRQDPLDSPQSGHNRKHFSKTNPINPVHEKATLRKKRNCEYAILDFCSVPGKWGKLYVNCKSQTSFEMYQGFNIWSHFAKICLPSSPCSFSMVFRKGSFKL